jgi:TIR domain
LRKLVFSNRIFICHSDEQKTQAQSIANTLRGRGYTVFIDKDSLPPGRTFDQRIEKAVRGSSAFVFLISPQSVQDGRFTLTELKYAAKKWPHAAGHVLPVMAVTTGLAAVPEYLKGVTILEPHGNLGAEVAHEISGLVTARNYPKMFAAAAVVAAIIGVGIYAVIPSQPSPTPAPLYQSSPVPETTYSAVARCTRTGAVGKGTGSTRQEASDDAVNDCEDRGGVHGCCQVIDVREE